MSLSGAYTKNSKLAELPIRSDTLAALKPFLDGKMPQVQVFKLTDKTAKMLRFDLAAAGIDFEDESGRKFDFHALRYQFGTLLAAAGVSPKTAQMLMRHSDIKLTMDIYTHTMTGQEKAAIDSLPDLTTKKDQETGTE